MVCLAETNVSGLSSKFLWMGFEDVVEVAPRGRSGGILLAWRKGVILDVVLVCDNFATVIVKSDPPDRNWLLSFVYGPSRWNEKSAFWYALDSSGRNFVGLQLCIGDFHAILNQDMKWG